MHNSKLSPLSITQTHTLFLVTTHLYSSCVCGMKIAAGFLFSFPLGTVSLENGILLALIITELAHRK